MRPQRVTIQFETGGAGGGRGDADLSVLREMRSTPRRSADPKVAPPMPVAREFDEVSSDSYGTAVPVARDSVAAETLRS